MTMLKDTIISAFNYDGTLLKWLKKVEDALQGDTLTNIEVVTNSDYSMQLKMTFGDGSFILSPSFTNKGRGIVSISKTSTSGLVDTYTVTYTDNTTSTFTVTNAEGFNANNLYSALTAGTGIELTNDGQHVTVTAKRLLNEIVDSQGHNRFFENNGIDNHLEGVTLSYKKASLSGTHLMLVIAGTIAENTTIPNGVQFARFNLPSWVLNKVVPVWSVFVEEKTIVAHSSDWTSQQVNVGLAVNQYDMSIAKIGETTFSKERYFRIEFDILIDTD